MQTTFNLNPGNGVPGQMFDDGPKEVRAFPAAHDIQFGVLCEFVTVSGNREIQMVQDSGTTGSFTPNLAGISLYDPMHEQAYANLGATPGAGYWRKGEMVPVLRRGRVWVQFDNGGTWPEYATVNVWHSSDGTHNQGVFTMTATQTTAGAEIDAAPSTIQGIEKALAQGNFTDFSGDTVGVAVVAINLAP